MLFEVDTLVYLQWEADDEWWPSGVCKETVVGVFKILSRHLPGGTEEVNRDNLNQDSR
jgi:hypothetical protein